MSSPRTPVPITSSRQDTDDANASVEAVYENGHRVDQPEIIRPLERAYTPDVDISTLSLEELSTSDDVYNRELSWLDFNWRVLHEAMDPRTPLLERAKFLAITASNLDEFFRKRVGGLKRQQAAGMANLTLPRLDTRSTTSVDRQDSAPHGGDSKPDSAQ